MSLKQHISATIILVIALLFAVAPAVPQAGFSPAINYQRQEPGSIMPQQFGYEKAEESWGCEYTRELPGMCIMRV